MDSESAVITPVALLRALRQRDDEAQEIAQLTQRLQSRWQSKRTEGSLSAQEIEVIRSLRNRLGELAEPVREDLTKSLLKLQLLKRELEHETERRVALADAKLKPIAETLKTLDELLVAEAAPVVEAETRERSARKKPAEAKPKSKKATKSKSRKTAKASGKRGQRNKSSAQSNVTSETTPDNAHVESETGKVASKSTGKGKRRKPRKTQ